MRVFVVSSLLAGILIVLAFCRDDRPELPAVDSGTVATDSGTAAADSGPPAEMTSDDAKASRAVVEAKGRLVGRVLSAGSRPVSGARVFFETKRNFAGPDILAHPTGVSTRLAKLPQTKTNEAGEFEIPATERGQLLVVAEGHVGTRVATPATAGRRFEVEDVVLEPRGQVSGIVVDPTGAPIAGAAVQVARSDRPIVGRANDNAARTAADGRFAVAGSGDGEELILIADHPDHAPGRASCQMPGTFERVDGIEIRLGKSTTIQGTVTNASAHARGVLRVEAFPQRGRSLSLRHQRHLAEVEEDGSFVVQGLIEGLEYNLRVVRDGDSGLRILKRVIGPIVQATSGASDVELLALPPVRVRFRLGTSQLIRSARAHAAVEKRGRAAYGGLLNARARRVSADASGVFEISVQPTDQEMQLALGVAAPGFAPVFRTGLQVPEDGIVDAGVLALEPRPTLQIRVRDSDGTPVPDARLRIAQSDRDRRAGSTFIDTSTAEDVVRHAVVPDEAFAEAQSDDSGLAVLTFDHAGHACDVFVSHRGFAITELKSIEMPAVGEAVETTAVLVRGATARVEVTDADGKPVGGVKVAGGLVEEGSRTKSKETDAAGVAVFAQLRAGEYVFTVTDARYPKEASAAVSRAARLEGQTDPSARRIQIDGRSDEVTTVRLRR